ncbi:unnamed protein product [Litomosoides sigmodontis]|uniref:Uncharacterized protein n=1 Tax=Litomosoides sigmodontis TaxID=42156 RepID=A0A3P7JMS0_LITSI|nr:unnamed protein product [Litomosoides sigmodontis]
MSANGEAIGGSSSGTIRRASIVDYSRADSYENFHKVEEAGGGGGEGEGDERREEGGRYLNLKKKLF